MQDKCDFLAELVVDECGEESIKKSMQCNFAQIQYWLHNVLGHLEYLQLKVQVKRATKCGTDSVC